MKTKPILPVLVALATAMLHSATAQSPLLKAFIEVANPVLLAGKKGTNPGPETGTGLQ